MMTMKMMHSPKQRPRVEGEREDEIFEACVDLLIQVGYDRLTMDAVAKRARASKATLYRRWETKASLVVDALVRAKGTPHVEDHDTGDLRSDLPLDDAAPGGDGPMVDIRGRTVSGDLRVRRAASVQ